MYKQEVNKRTGDLCDLIRCLSLISENGILQFGDEDEYLLFKFNLNCSTSGLDSIREWIRHLSVSSDSAAESGINKMAQALGPREIAGPPAFDISGDAASAGSRWKRWKKAFQYYLLARGVNNPNQQKALLLLKMKDVKDNEQLQTFADTMRCCRDTLVAMGCKDELNSGRVLLQLVEKLPIDLKRKWLNRNYEITEGGHLPRLDDVLDLVETETRKRSDPVFGGLIGFGTTSGSGTTQNKSTKFNSNQKRQVFATDSTNNKPVAPCKAAKCPRCAGSHFLNQCASFRKMNVPDRLTFVKEKKLCINCFMRGHSDDVCTRNWVCKAPGCATKHNTWLHSAIVAATTCTTMNPPTAEDPVTRSRQVADTSQVVQGFPTRKRIVSKISKIALPIIPVVVSDPSGQFLMNTWALLDSGSNSTFCTKQLINALKLKTKQTQIQMTTLGLENASVEALLADVRVEDPTREKSYLLKGVLGRDQLNIKLDSLVTQDEIRAWPHLRDIAEHLHLPDTPLNDEVHLLIGLDQPDILVPRDICRGEAGEPYATLTGLGWSLEWTHN